MLQQIPIELILAVQQFVTCYGRVDHCLSYSGYLKNGDAYIDLYAKLPMSAYPKVRITSTPEEVTVMVYVLTDTVALQNGLSKDFSYFIDMTNKLFTPDEFIKANRDFWFNKGKSDLFL